MVTQTTDFITELIRAANQIHSVTPYERRRLLERGVATTKALRELLLVNNKVVPISSNLLREIEELIPDAEGTPECMMSGVLMIVAEEIRQLRILAQDAS